jgi:hypothetical protein
MAAWVQRQKVFHSDRVLKVQQKEEVMVSSWEWKTTELSIEPWPTDEITNDIMDAHADTVSSTHRYGVTGKAGRPLIADSAADVASSRAKISTAPKDGATRRSLTVPFSFTCQPLVVR